MSLHLPFHSLEAMCELLEEILDDALVVVAPAENVIERRKAMRLASLFLMIKLLRVKSVIAYNAPVVRRRRSK